MVLLGGAHHKMAYRLFRLGNLKDSTFFRKKFPFFSVCFWCFSGKRSETDQKKAENFFGKKAESFKVRKQMQNKSNVELSPVFEGNSATSPPSRAMMRIAGGQGRKFFLWW